MITCYKDLFDHLDADWEPGAGLKANEARLSRRVYKSTECGAWAALIPPGERAVGTRPQTWTGEYSRCECGVILTRVRREHSPWTWAIHAPGAVRSYFLAEGGETHNGALVVTVHWDDIVAATVPAKDPDLRLWKGKIDVPVMKQHSGGVRFGSIVEGCDGGVEGGELLFPFPEGLVDFQLAEIEERCRQIWDETHGCPGCWGGTGDGSVDPNCPDCKGGGTVI